MTATLVSYLEKNQNRAQIFAVGQFLEDHVTANWDVILTEKKAQLNHAFATAGEPAYGTYLNFLYHKIHSQLKDAGLRVSTRLPGDMSISREWGTNSRETDQYRCMWSTLYELDTDEPLGTIVTVLPHDHTQFRVPTKPPVFALAETTKDEVVATLSKRFAAFDFANLPEFHVYIAQLRANPKNQ